MASCYPPPFLSYCTTLTQNPTPSRSLFPTTGMFPRPCLLGLFFFSLVIGIIFFFQERETTCARREMEQLRLEYLAREERFMLDGDRNELRTIKQELDELR